MATPVSVIIIAGVWFLIERPETPSNLVPIMCLLAFSLWLDIKFFK